MPRPMTIAIVFHETADAARMRRYRIWQCADIWRREGMDVRLVSGPVVPRDADIVIPHVDLTQLPDAYRPLLEAPGQVLNRSMADVRRRRVSRILVAEDDGYDGPVIVKTNNNCGSHPERAVLHGQSIAARLLAALGGAARAAGRMLAAGSVHRLTYASALPTRAYAVFDSKRHLPRGVFRNPDLVVEKFLPETDGRYYYLRSYSFLGEEGLAVRSRSLQPVVVGRTGSELEYVPVDGQILEARRAMGFDYGKIDYLMHDGKAVIIDLNPTPTFGAVYTREFQIGISERMARGLSQFQPTDSEVTVPPLRNPNSNETGPIGLG